MTRKDELKGVSIEFQLCKVEVFEEGNLRMVSFTVLKDLVSSLFYTVGYEKVE